LSLPWNYVACSRLKITDRTCEDYFLHYVIQKGYSRAYTEDERVKATGRVPNQLKHKEIQLDMTFLRANNIFIPYISPYNPRQTLYENYRQQTSRLNWA
jgi:hypothetical protein